MRRTKRKTGYNMSHWSQRLKSKRSALGLNQFEAAAVIGISASSLYGVEQGRQPGPRIRPKIEFFLMATYEKKTELDGTVSLRPVPRK